MNSSLRNVRLYDIPEPRGASLFGTMFAGAYNALASLWSSDPSKPLTRSEEAEEVRAMARGLVTTDPGFASDLFAAADRHENQS